MVDSISGICLRGGNFEKDTKFIFFKNSLARFFILYGQNGSGKTTISRAFQKIKRQDKENIQSAYLIDDNAQEVELSATDQEHIYVYNEDYIENKVKLQNDGLDTIVLLGNQVALEEKIKETREKYDNVKENREKQENICKQYIDINNINSPRYYNKRIKDNLRGSGNWADRERLILEHKNNAAVSDETIASILQLKPNTDEVTLANEYQKQYELLEKVKSGESRKLFSVPRIPSFSFEKEKISSLLQERLEKPELSEREKRLLQMVDNGHIDQLRSMKDWFSRENVKECPFCLQPVSKGYKFDLVQSIQHVLTKKVETHKQVLTELKISPITFENLDTFKDVNESLVDKIVNAEHRLTESVERLNALIQQKIENPYVSIEQNLPDIQQKKEQCNNLLNSLQLEVNQYNENIANINRLRVKLQTINKQMAYFKIKPLHDIYTKKKSEQKIAESALQNSKKEESKLKQTLENLLAQKKNIKIAVEMINHSLSYIFFSPNRLKLEVAQDSQGIDCYRLLSKGNPVKPSCVSVGERNIIALAYFFTEIFNQTDPVEGYKNEAFVVIDDPVSSFDFDNKVGIMSFLKAKFNQVLSGNNSSKVLVMTHDLEILFGLDKAGDEIFKKINHNRPKDSRYQKHCGELCNNNIKDFKHSRNEYSLMMKEVYRYACDKPNDMGITIGNILRRILEAFGTFMYKKGIVDLSCDEDVLNELPDEDTRDYFENCMYRLVLNGQSHMQDRISMVKDYNFTPILSSDEMQKIAQAILCFMYLLQKHHVLSHLKDEKDAANNLEKWCQEIKHMM